MKQGQSLLFEAKQDGLLGRLKVAMVLDSAPSAGCTGLGDDVKSHRWCIGYSCCHAAEHMLLGMLRLHWRCWCCRLQDAQCAICVPVKACVKRTTAARAQQQQQQQAQSQAQQQAQQGGMPNMHMGMQPGHQAQQGGMPNIHMGMQPGHQVRTGGGGRGRAWGHAGEGGQVFDLWFLGLFC